MNHAQTRRFLDPDFVGLGTDFPEPPLRGFVERLASGERLDDMDDAAPIKKWLAAFRLVPWILTLFFFPSPDSKVLEHGIALKP